MKYKDLTGEILEINKLYTDQFGNIYKVIDSENIKLILSPKDYNNYNYFSARWLALWGYKLKKLE